MKSSYIIFKKENENGFTLLEIIIVTVIIALISVIAIPSISQLKGKHDLERTARMMVSEFNFVQQTALAYGKTCRIEFFTQVNAYRLRMPGETRLIWLPEGISIASNNFPAIDGGGYRLLSFNRNGAPNRGGTISLANERGDRLYIIIYLATGRIRISETPPANW